MDRARKFLRLTATDRRLLISAALLLGAIRLGLWLFPFLTLRQLLRKLATIPNRSDSLKSGCQERVVWAVVVASRYVPMSTCLTQALAAQVLLARRGYSAHLHIGVAKEGAEAKLKAHAWVESDGKVLIGSSEPGRYMHLLALEGEEP